MAPTAVAADDRIGSLRRAKIRCVLFAAAFAVIAGVHTRLRGFPVAGMTWADWIPTLACSACAVLWLRADAIELHRDRTGWMLFTAILPWLALPMWIVSSRGRRGLPALAACIAILVGITIASVGAALAALILRELL
jgi:hypothetical protein